MTRNEFAKEYPRTKCADCKFFDEQYTPCDGDFELLYDEGYCLFDMFAYHCDYPQGDEKPDILGKDHYHFGKVSLPF